MPEKPRSRPDSFRMQVWTFDGPENSPTLKSCIWEEPPGRERDWTVADRVADAMAAADDEASVRNATVLMVSTPIIGGGRDNFTWLYPARPADVNRSSYLDPRDALLLMVEGGDAR